MSKRLKTVMLIDDDNSTNIYNEYIISDMGVTEEIVIFQNGEKALKFLTTKNDDGKYPQPDIILLDINMPIMNGWEFLAEYNKIPQEQRSVVITMLTSSMNTDDKRKAEEMEVINGFINKPLSEEKFNEILDTFF